MARVNFADVVHQQLVFSTSKPAEALLLTLIDTPWMQRLRDISQTANTRLLYMFSEHSRFGHSLGVAYLACVLMDRLAVENSEHIEPYRLAVAAAALLHDLGHLAPGSHTAAKSWFPHDPDRHEALGAKIIAESPDIRALLENTQPGLGSVVSKILQEDESLPPWTWQIISGGSWNVDRGNWCVVDSILAGVSYGQYNIPALLESLLLTPDKQLALTENRLDAMMHFAVSRHALYRQVYQHRVILAADTLYKAVIKRARELDAGFRFADETMSQALAAKHAADLSLNAIFAMRESWWRYHLFRWSASRDKILADLCTRLLNRQLFKTVRVRETETAEKLYDAAERAVRNAGFDPVYYLHQVSTSDMLTADYHQPMLVRMDDGSFRPLTEADPLMTALVKESSGAFRKWIAMPAEAKALLQRIR